MSNQTLLHAQVSKLDDISDKLYKLDNYIGGMLGLVVTISSSDDAPIGITMAEFATILGVAKENANTIRCDVDKIYDEIRQEHVALQAKELS